MLATFLTRLEDFMTYVVNLGVSVLIAEQQWRNYWGADG